MTATVDGDLLVGESMRRAVVAQYQADGVLHVRPIFQLLPISCISRVDGFCDQFPDCSGDAYRWSPALENAINEGKVPEATR